MHKILIVEDEHILGQMYKDKFVQAGFSVIITKEAEEGIELMKTERPDLVLLDILLPRANGIFFLKQIKADPELSSIPVVAFSNYDDPTTKKEALKLGAKDYLIKTSYTPQEIIEKIKTYLQ